MNSGKVGSEAEKAQVDSSTASNTADNESVVVELKQGSDEGQANEAAGKNPLEAELTATQLEAEKWRATAYRYGADLENTRKRFQREREELRKYGNEGFLKDLLPVIDNLERAVAHASSEDGLYEGVEMVLRQFTQLAENYGAKPFEAKGKPFDPQVHEAMSQVPMEGVEAGTVVEVFQRGWMLHERLVRPAMVIVAAAPQQQEDSVGVDGEGQVAQAQSDETPAE